MLSVLAAVPPTAVAVTVSGLSTVSAVPEFRIPQAIADRSDLPDPEYLPPAASAVSVIVSVPVFCTVSVAVFLMP